MKRVLSFSAACSVLLAGFSFSAAAAGKPSNPIVIHRYRPMLKRGPEAAFARIAQQPDATYPVFTCQEVNVASSATCYDPYQIRHAYGIDNLINSGFDGSGKTIVIIDAFQSPKIVDALNTFSSTYALPILNSPGAGTFSIIAPDGLTAFDPKNQDQVGWAEEISLDVLWAHAIAPGANIVLVLSKSDADADLLSVTKYVVSHRLGDVISQSFGEAESCADPSLLVAEHDVFAQAALAGISVFASAGDNGAGQPTCDGSALQLAASTPASDPLVTGVGGTELHATAYCFASNGCDPAFNPAAGTYQSEIVWNESAAGLGAGGGGLSILYSKPAFQSKVRGLKVRGVPDVTYNAAVLHGVLTYLDIPGIKPGFYLFGGTSSGSPQWAALTAIADQKAGYSLGFLNTALYNIVSHSRVYSSSYHDITVGDNSFGGITGYQALPGWDLASGLGSPRALNLVDALISSITPADAFGAIAASEPPATASSKAQKAGKQHPH